VVNRLFSSVRRHRWCTVTVICVCIAILGFGAYFATSKWTGKNEKGVGVGLPQPGSETPTSEFREELESGVILEETKITVPEPGGALGWSFGAERIEYDLDNNRARLVDAKGIRFVDDKPEIEIQAGVAKLDFASGRVDFEEYVTVKLSEGPSFSAKSATWDPGAKKFRAYGNIQYKNRSSEIFGDEMEIDLELETARVKGNARFRSPALRGPEGGFAR
jgi:LPS export ABC transporter protein LptC